MAYKMGVTNLTYTNWDDPPSGLQCPNGKTRETATDQPGFVKLKNRQTFYVRKFLRKIITPFWGRQKVMEPSPFFGKKRTGPGP